MCFSNHLKIIGNVLAVILPMLFSWVLMFLAVNKIILNARNAALEFYKALNYNEKGPYHSDTGIPHTRMEKELNLK